MMKIESRALATARACALGLLLSLPASARAQSVVVVRDEGGAPVRDAEVYRNCTLQGLTSGAGLLILPALSAGDRLQVRKLVHTGPSMKGGHDGWSYHAWRTNITMENDGRQTDFMVSDPSLAQSVVLRRQNTQIGWNLLASVEYNASAANLDEIARGLQSASRYLFDVSDGQFFIEQAAIHEERQNWAHADLQFFANMWPNANGSVGGPAVLAGSAHHMYLPGPGFDGAGYMPGTWPTANGFRTLVHEHGHYGLGLWDEYKRLGGSARCTLDRDSVPEERRASIMQSQFNASELCHDGNHNPMTDQGEVNGQSTWATIADLWSNAAWTLRTPMTRGAVNPGPDDLSCFARLTPRVVSVVGEACAGLRLTARGTSGAPVVDVPVDLRHAGRVIFQGNTDRAGQVPIYGAVAGDVVSLRPRALRRREYCMWWDGTAQVDGTCAPLAITSDWRCFPGIFDVPFPVIRFIHQGDPAPDVFIRIPADDPAALFQVVVEQDGLGRQPVPLAYDAKTKAFSGSFPVDTSQALEFTMEFTGPGAEGKAVTSAARLRGARFDAQAPVGPGGAIPLLGADGDVELALGASALAHGAGVLASEALIPQQPPAGLVAGGAAVIVAGEQPLLEPAELGLRFDPAKVDAKTARVFRLEGDDWVPLATLADAETGRARAHIEAWGTYAVFGKAAF